MTSFANLQGAPRWTPPTRTDALTLWERAKAMFATVVAAIVSAAHLTQRACFSLTERRDLRMRLVPLEKLVRVLLIVEAATHLLMTRDGRKLRAEISMIEPPAPPPPVGIAKPAHSTRILMPGWHSIAAYHPRIDPRVVEREQREALERQGANAEALTQATDDPSNWSCRFSVLRWTHDDCDTPAQKPAPKRKPFYEDTNFPLVPGMTLAHQTHRNTSEHNDASLNHGHDLARRIEALSRILANPLPAIRRLARRLAALAPEDLTDPWIAISDTSRWPHAIPDYQSATLLLDRALRVLATTRKHDPG